MYLRVSSRLLWVGEAAYPLSNIVRVRTFVLKPDRGQILLDFLKWLAIAAVILFVLQAVMGESRGDPLAAAGPLVVVAAVALLSQLVFRLTRPDRYALTVETAGAAVAVVTLEQRAALRELVGHIVHAIEHPEAEFSVRVERLDVDLRRYHFGDSVNMTGGMGNTGKVA
ncbi:DUF6232 family protein [Streptomyces sp. NPDC060048]|uniref:DUF6232 family protein n=1 Tax=unclassified Streptomyces TaxID=2593676 RepID=UPI00369927B6